MLMGDVITNVSDSRQDVDLVSLEDIAWADSCLVKDPELPDELSEDGCFNSFGEVLLEVLSSCQPGTVNSTARRDGLAGDKTHMEVLANDEILTSQDGESMSNDKAPLFREAVKSSEAAKSSDDDLIKENEDTFLSRFNLEDILLATYNECSWETENPDLLEDMGIPEFTVDPLPTENLFEVWDLDTACEENEIIKQLNDALANSSSCYLPSNSDDSRGVESFIEPSINDLISGIADMSFDERND